MDDMEKMENDNIIVLTDEDGTDVEFEFCASIEYEGERSMSLLPTDDDDGEVVILQVMEDAESDDEDEVTTSAWTTRTCSRRCLISSRSRPATSLISTSKLTERMKSASALMRS